MPILRVTALKKYFPLEKSSVFDFLEKKPAAFVRAVDGVSFEVDPGETFSLVGETGSGKTTIAKMVMRLIEPTDGNVVFEDKDIWKLGSKDEILGFRRNAQMIFQDPYACLNPRMTVEDIVGTPFDVHRICSGAERRSRISALLERVGLTPASQMLDRNSVEFSGGQRQRIGIARALALNPKLVVADEPVASLDVSIRAQILNLMGDLKKEFGLTYLMITHDLTVVKHVSDWVMVLYLGRPMELAPKKELFESPMHPYTRALISAIPRPDPKRRIRREIPRGEIPSPINPPAGCRFHTRCADSKPKCATEEPNFVDVGGRHFVACHL